MLKINKNFGFEQRNLKMIYDQPNKIRQQTGGGNCVPDRYNTIISPAYTTIYNYINDCKSVFPRDVSTVMHVDNVKKEVIIAMMKIGRLRRLIRHQKSATKNYSSTKSWILIITNISTSPLFLNRYSTLQLQHQHPLLIYLTLTPKIAPYHRPPTIYILNVTSIVKPYAIEHLRCDVYHFHHDIIITESWLRPDHPDGGVEEVVIYLKSSISSQIHIVLPHAVNDALETLCLKCVIDSEPYFICAIYHSPNPLYEVFSLMGYIDELSNTALVSNSKIIIVMALINSTIIPFFKQVYILYSGVPPTKPIHQISTSPINKFMKSGLILKAAAITKYIKTLIINFSSKTFTNSQNLDKVYGINVNQVNKIRGSDKSFNTSTLPQIDASTLNTHLASTFSNISRPQNTLSYDLRGIKLFDFPESLIISNIKYANSLLAECRQSATFVLSLIVCDFPAGQEIVIRCVCLVFEVQSLNLTSN
ncbi:hypothetical protein HELRODRAFT_166858 [Helobdella robusta]|uniref:Uncharacterized protein n=1 Tax=Helobdella robusta TaxID=6412 RepID=T1EYN2_HELRO|nr:hypothetical protein HELRODRAFT_166858 [Helobdella robusta]ESO11810.1 hypothetical protein HELRODRAFT_166858 [Helobdella robusta]